MIRKDRIIQSLLVTLLPAFTLCFYGPMSIYLNNSNEIWYTYALIIYKVIAVSLVAWILLFLVAMIIPDKIYRKYLFIVFGLGTLLWIQGTFINWHYPLLDGSKIKWEDYRIAQIIDTFIWVLSMGAIYHLFKKIKIDIIAMFALIIVYMQVVEYLFLFNMADPSLRSEDQYYTDYSKELELSKTSNVVIFILDTYRSDIFENILEENKDIKTAYKDFTYFNNAAGAFNITQMSIPYLLSGEMYNNIEKCDDYKNKIFDNSIMSYLREKQYLIHRISFYDKAIFGDYYCDNYMKIDSSKEFGMMSSLYKLVLFRYLPSSLKPVIKINYEDFIQRSASRQYEQYSSFDIMFKEDVEHNGITAKNEQGVLSLYHLIGLHSPLGDEWGKAIDHGQDANDIAKQTAILDMKMLENYINQLKDAGIYDKTLIIIVGDHGCPNYETYGGDLNEYAYTPFKDESLYIMNSARPLMLVKPIDAKQSMIQVNQAPVTLGDIPATICDELGIENKFKGKSIFSIDEYEERERLFKYYMFISWEKDYLPTTKEFVINGKISDIHSWKETGYIYENGEKKPIIYGHN